MGRGEGSNKVVVNPGNGGVIQRRARPRPQDCTLPAAASDSSARCTVRWLDPSASARAELDQHSPSARKASKAPFSSSTGRASTATSRACRGTSTNPRFVALTSASGRSIPRSRPISTRSRIRCDSSTNLVPKAPASNRSRGASPGHASPSARASASNTGRVTRGTTSRASRTTFRQASTTRVPDENNASTSSSKSGRSSPRAIRRAAGRCRSWDALFTSAVNAGIPASRAERWARAIAARAACVRKRRIAIPAIASSWMVLSAAGKGEGSKSASLFSASSRLPIRRRRRIAR